jgi:hypothetical protein
MHLSVYRETSYRPVSVLYDCVRTLELNVNKYVQPNVCTYSYPFMDTAQEYDTLDRYEKLIVELR